MLIAPNAVRPSVPSTGAVSALDRGLFDVESGVDSGEGEQARGVGGDVCEDELVAVGLGSLLRVDEQVDSGAVDELEPGEIEHDVSWLKVLGVVEFVLQCGG